MDEAQELIAFAGGRAANSAVKKLGSLQFRDAKGKFTRNEYGGSENAKKAKQEAADQAAAQSLGGGIICR